VLQLLAQQLPDPTQVINAATSQGWQSGLLAIIIIIALTSIGWILKHLITTGYEREKTLALRTDERETAHNKRVSELEDYIKVRLIEAIQNYSIMFQSNHDAVLKTQECILTLTNTLLQLNNNISSRPCFWSVEKQVEIIQNITTALKPKEIK
jgi:hypothetical protein